MSGTVLVSHPTGNANVAAVVETLHEREMLAAYFTCIAWRPESKMARLVPGSLRATLERRARVRIPTEFIRTRPTRELLRNLILRAGKNHWIARASHPFSIDGVYRDLDKYVARSLSKFDGLRGVYAYEDGALHQFRAAAKSGVSRIYDLPIGYWRANRQISAEEAELQPEWKGTLKALADDDAKCARKDEELALAELVMVPSTFVKTTLKMFPGSKQVVVNPFGVPAAVALPRELTERNRPLRVLFVGGLSQRKGLSYLFDAVENAGNAVTLTVIGRKAGESEALDQCCARHRWIPSLPHGEILAEMRRQDVFVFPSLFEGLALVLGEALSQGLPVITTPNSGGGDILRDGIDGFLVPIRDSDAITARLLQLREDRELLKRMSDSALERARQVTWESYKEGVAAAVRDTVDRG